MKKLLFAIIFAFVASSCSLFKMTISTGDTPLPIVELNTRMMTRGFYNEFTSKVIAAADSIIATSTSHQTKMNALRWKLEATSAATQSSFQTVPQVALLNTWVLCRQMNAMLVSTPDAKLFGKQSPIARNASKELLAKIERLAKSVLPADMFAKMNTFVDQYCTANRVSQTTLAPDNLMLEWVQYLEANDKEYVRTVGSVSEVMADMTDRFSSYTSQFGNELSWSKDLITMQLAQDSIRDKLSMQLDSTARDFRRMVLILEHSPELIDTVSKSLNKQLTSLIETMNASVDGAFMNIARERVALQEFFAEQRELLMKETKDAADTAVKSALNMLPTIIGKILVYIILAAVVIFTLPFLLGMWLGGLRARRKERKKKE